MQRRNGRLACPTGFDQRGQVSRDIQRPAVGPALVEPGPQPLCGVVVQQIEVQLTLPGQTLQREWRALHARQHAADLAIGD